ncbi:unnamed protein product [Dovyalis caffra]|uniref:Uncharacterized protein n=1 Tax=Dovyalis caffra TaxID=77055 RepID=A0AAV1RQF6_9ROSI|nr:unnamed protein product [Dovyalis caffra]
MSMSTSHILVYPFPAPGHMIPLLNLTHRLLSDGLIITISITPNNLPLLAPLLSIHPSSQLQHLLLPTPPNPPSGLLAETRSLRDHHYPILLDWFQSHSSPPLAIISDFFLGWTNQLACQVDIPRIVFSPSGSFSFSIFDSLWRDHPQNENPNNMDFVVSFADVPNSPSFPWWQISHAYRRSKEGDPDREFFRDTSLENLKSWGFVVNSFSQLEHVYLDRMKTQFGEDHVWAVGPILPTDGSSSEVPCHEVLTWLDGQKGNSVLYICFGSREMLTWEQMEELVAALGESDIHFVWCARQPSRRDESNEFGVLPDEFEERVRVSGRGFIVKDWAPQVAILEHPSVGTFLTHCGWNSVLEGIVAGVVMLTWPMGADQFYNAQLVVDELGVGIRVGEDTVKIPKSTELAQILNESMEENRPERQKARKLKEASLEAVKGGSSNKDLDRLVKSLNAL